MWNVFAVAASFCIAVEYFCVRDIYADTSLSIVNVFVIEADTDAIHRTCVLLWSVFVVGFPNWHESGCHSQEQVDWGTRPWFYGRQRCRHKFFSPTQMHAASPFDQHEGRGQPLRALLDRQGEGHLQTSLQSHHFATTSIHTNTSKHRCEVCNTTQLFVPWSTLIFCLR